MTTPTANPQPLHAARQVLAFRFALAAAGAEILLLVITTLRAAPPEAPLYAGILWALIKSLPLLLVLPGLWRGNPRAAVWLCFLLCVYSLTALLAALQQPPRRWLGVIELAVISGGFVAGLLAARWSRPSATPRIPAP